ncbi:MAG: hypothetical protein ACRDRP_04900 [Pseudonocardiaceae bacterium]
MNSVRTGFSVALARGRALGDGEVASFTRAALGRPVPPTRLC